MAGKAFDVSVKDLIETDAQAWATLLLGAQAGRVRIVDADLATVSATSDKVVLVESDAGEYLWNVEAQSSHAGKIPAKLHHDGALLRRRHGLAVRGMALLLRRDAEASLLTGVHEEALPGATTPYLAFRYEVVRVWEIPEETFLQGGLATLPLATLTDEASRHLPEVIARLDERLLAEAEPDLASRLRVATLVLLGLRYPRELAERLVERFTKMEDSVTYQAIIEKGISKGITQGISQGITKGKSVGIIEGERQLLLRLGTKKFGPPSDAMRRKLESLNDRTVLETLSERILDVDSWADLLADV